MPKMEKVYLHNPSSEETITLVSISATTSHFHASFFQNGVSYSVFSKMSFLFLLPTPNGSLLNEVLQFLILYQLPSKFELSTETHINSPTREGIKYCIGVPAMLEVYTVTAGLTSDLLCC